MAFGTRDTAPPDPPPPQNTVVVMPKTPPTNRSSLWLVFWGIGLLMGLSLRSLIGVDDPQTVDAEINTPVPQEAAVAPTFEVNVRAVLEMPTATNTPPVINTLSTSTLTPTINDCTTVEPGQICQVPHPPPPTPTPYPSCLRMDELSPGDWCVWPVASPAVPWWASVQ